MELPRVEPIEYKRNITVLGIILLILHGTQGLIPGVEHWPKPLSWGIVILFFCAVMFLFAAEWKRDIPLFCRNFGNYFKFFLPKFGIFLPLYFIISVSVVIVSGTVAANQIALGKLSGVLLFFLSVFFAPLQEEALYRGFLRRIIADDIFFILVSGLVFGLAHVLQPGQTPGQLLYIIVYSFIGCFLAWLYVKTDNICVPVMGHSCYNLLCFILLSFS